MTNTYSAGSSAQATVTIQDGDQPTNILDVATVNNPTGIDYNSNNNSLIVSVNWSNGVPSNFLRVASNGATSAWSTVSHLIDEVKLATVKLTTNGFTAGDMYYGTGVAGQIGWVSANGSSVNTNWAVLPGETNLLRGSLYVDQTGVFSNDVVVVTGGHGGENPDLPSGGGGVWRVHSPSNAVKLAQITNSDGSGRILEAVITVPNDATEYGPWAGKILVAAEQQTLDNGNTSFGLIYSIDTGGTVTAYDLGISEMEDLDLVASGQTLYCLNFIKNGSSTVFKIPAGNFSAFANDVLITHEARPSSVFAVHWDGGRFLVRQIPTGATSVEHVTFAPIP